MRITLRFAVLLLAWLTLLRTDAWAQTCPGSAPGGINYITTTDVGSRQGTGTAGTVGSANTFTDASGSTGTTVTFNNYRKLGATGNTNTFAVGTNGSLSGQSLVWQLNYNSGGGILSPPADALADNQASVTLTFGRSVSGLTLRLQDLDLGGNFRDNVTFNGYTAVTATGTPTGTPVTLSSANFAVGTANQYVAGTNSVQGIGASDPGGATAPNGNLTVSFSQDIRALTIIYRNTQPITVNTDRTQTLGINSVSWCRLAPIANNVTNSVTLPTSAGQVDIDGLSSTVDGTLQSYTITAIPPATQGVLYYNTTGSTYVAVANNQVLTAAQAASLRFEPASNGTATSASFSYRATDDAGLLSANTATFTIPLRVLAPCVSISTLSFNAPRATGQDWRARAAESVPAASPVTQVTTSNYAVGANAANSLTTAGFNSTQTLLWNTDYSANSANKSATVTFNFTRPVSNFRVQVQDIDSGTDYIDQVTFTGANAGTAITPSLSKVNSNSTFVSVSGNSATGSGNTNSPTEATVIAYFPEAITSLTITYRNVENTNDGASAFIGIDFMDWCRLAPETENITNSVVSNAAGQVPVNELSSIVDGAVSTYRILTIPTAAQGILYVNGVAVTGARNLTALEATQLTFDPAATSSGTVSFTYTVTDDATQTDQTPATYTIPVSASGAAGTVAACANPGRDGSPTGLTTNPNTYYPGTATAAVGATAITVGGATGATPIAVGDLLLVIQMQGADINATNTDAYGDGVAGGAGNGNLDNANFTAGNYEYVVANSAVGTTGGTIQLTSALKNGYQNANATNATGQRRFQVIRVPQYGNLTLGASITATAWNGTVGGIVVIDVAKQLNLNGNTINASGAGFRGGAGRLLGGTAGFLATDYRTASTSNGSKGEGTAGTPRYVNSGTAVLDNTTDGYPTGDNGRGAPGNAGGGGTDGNPTGNDQNTGGGGGANGGSGGRGGNAWATGRVVGGEPGAAFSAVSSSRLVLGGGGGAGVVNNNTPYASSGTAGGGIVIVRTGTVSGTGSIIANGTNVPNGATIDGSGGGGAGGSILITATTPTSLSGLTLTANGGNGGSNSPGAEPHGPGGGGGGGVILANGAVQASNVVAGLNGVTNSTNTPGAYGAQPGLVGATNTQINAAIANSTSGANCPADVTTTITGPTTLSVGQPAGSNTSYTATFTNNGTGAAANVTRLVTLPAGATVTAANLPAGATFTTVGNVTTIDFGTTATLASGASNSVSFSFTAPTTAGSYALTSNVATDANQGVDAAANTATLTLQVNSAPANCGPSYFDGVNAYSGLSADYFAGYFGVDGTAANDRLGYFNTNAGASSTIKRVDPQVNFMNSGTAAWGNIIPPAAGNTTNLDSYSARYRGSINIAQAGTYTFYLSSDDASYLWIDGAAVPAVPTLGTALINNGGTHGAQERTSATINLSAGLHNILLFYGEQFGENTFTFSYAGTTATGVTIAKQIVPNTILCAGLSNIPPVATTVTNSPAMANTNGPTTINSLAGTDQDGTVTGYVITTLPTPAQGVLSLNNVAVTAGQVITAAQAAQLQFDPAGTFNGPTASFTFQAVDNTGQYSNDAVAYNIPVFSATNIAGTVFEDVNYGGGSGRTLAASSGVGRTGATVELYNASGALVATTTTTAGGAYSFTGVGTGTYSVRVVNSTVTSSRTGYVAGLIPVQTFVNGDVNRVGGEAPEKQDAAANTGSQTLAQLTSGTLTAQSIASVTVGATPAPVSNVNFGFNFDVVTNTNNTGQGSLRQFITNSNALGDEASLTQSGSNAAGTLAAGKETSIFMIPSGNSVAGLRAGLVSGLTNGVAIISPTAVLPTITGANTTIDGTTQTFNVGNTNSVTLGAGGTVGTAATALSQVGGPEVQIVGARATYNGLNTTATNTTFRGLSIYGFTDNINTDINAANVLVEQNVIGASATSFTDPGATARTIGEGINLTSSDNGIIRNNLVGFNGGMGIWVLGNGNNGANNNLISNNEIRGNAREATAAPERLVYDGVELQGASTGNTVSGNLITESVGHGIDSFANTIGGNTVSGNTISNNGQGVVNNTGEEGSGIRVFSTTNPTNITGNVLTGNNGSGVFVVNGGNQVTISQNSIFSNTRLGIDLLSNAEGVNGNTNPNTWNGLTGASSNVTINDNGDGDGGGNGLLNFPVITSATIQGTNLVVQGFARPGAVIEFFNPGTTADGSGFGEGQTYLGTFTEGSTADTNAGTGTYGTANINGLNQGTDNTNRFTFTIPLTGSFAGLTSGSFLTSTATIGNSTSEFSGNAPVNTPPVPRDVTNVAVANNSGPLVLNPNLTATANGLANGVANTIASYTVTALPTSGTLAYNGVTLTSANIATTVISDKNLLTYQPAAGFSGSVSFTYTATDANGIVSTTHLNEAGTTTTAGPATYTIPVNAASDVTTTLAGPTILNAGLPSGTFTATFTNNGPNAASNVTQQVTLPAGATNIIVPAGATTSTAGGLTTINFGTVTTLASGVTNTFNYSFTAPTTSGSISQNSNVGTGSSQGANTAADVAILNGTVNPVADVATTIVGSAASVPNGQPASFTVTFTNNGPSSASGVTGSVQLPVGLTGVVVTGAAGTYNSTTGVVTYSLGTVANGGTTNSVISFTMPANGAVTAISTINTTTNEAGQTANDVASATISGTPTFDVTTLITGPATTVAGTMTTYSVLTINNGPSTATNIGQTVQLPANLTNVFVSNGGTYNVMTGVVTFPTLGAIASGVKVNNTVSFVAPAFVAPATTFPISATVSGDTNTANNTAFLNGNATLTNVEVTPASTINANIYTTITTPSAEALPGAPVTFTVVAGNKGQSTATNVVERIALPAGLTGVTISGNGATNANYDPSTGLVTLPTINSLVSGSANTYTITVSAPTSGMIAAVASISAATNDVMVADNVATTDVTVNAVSDVATTISGPAKVNAGQSVTYNVTTTNNGLVPAANVVQTVNIPAGLTSVILSGNGTYNPNTGIVTFPAIASQVSGNTVQNTITYNAPAVNSLMVIASVTSASPDNVKTNNTASVTTTTDAIADATVVISGPTTIVQGNQIDYLVVTTNNGPSTAANVATRVQLPSGLTGVVLSQGGAYNSTTGVVTFSTLATQRSGQEGTITNVIRFIAPAGVSQINATASVSTTTEEASYGNNTSSIVTTEVAPTTAQTNLSNTISSTPSDLTAGQPVTLSVTTTNGGTNAATGVVQRVALEVGLTITSISNNGTYDPATGIVTFPAIALPSGTAVTNTIVLAAPGTTPLQVRALVTGEQSDPVSTNNSAFLSLDVTPRADVLTTVSGPTSVVAGDAVTYSVVTLNNGPSLAASVVQTVTIPTGLTGVVVSNGGTYNQMTGVVTFSTITTQGIGASGQVMNTISFTAPSSAYTVVGSVSTTTTEPAGAGTNNSSTVMVGPANLAPVANSVVNALQTPEGNTAGPLSLSPLQGTDANGNNTIASYRITSIPPTTQGVLSLNGTAVVVGQPIDAADAGNLKFDPAAGFIGNAFFGYNAVDNAGAVSAAPALYTIPVGQDINSVYTLTTPKGEANPYVNGDIIANVFDVNSGAYNNATPQAVTDNGVRTASLTTGTLPAGTTLDPATGIITVTNRALLVAGSYPVTITTVDANGGTNPNSFVIVIGTRPLPVELKTFTVRAEKVDALLDWTTASEKNSDRFEIERSLNSTTFEKIGTVRAQGTTQNTTTYAFTDAGIGAKTQGIVYYRLRQVDTDGTVSYSPVRTVRFEAQAAVTAKLSVFPNPATASDRVVTLDLSTLPKGTYQASLLDATGRLLGTYSVEGGVNKVVDVQTLPTGTYIVVVRGNGLNLSQRLIKE